MHEAVEFFKPLANDFLRDIVQAGSDLHEPVGETHDLAVDALIQQREVISGLLSIFDTQRVPNPAEVA